VDSAWTDAFHVAGAVGVAVMLVVVYLVSRPARHRERVVREAVAADAA
jgi:hypothetical protein